jgi:hypothetical protein
VLILSHDLDICTRLRPDLLIEGIKTLLSA